MSFSISISGHTDKQEDFESVVETAKQAAQDIDDCCTGGLSAMLTGTDNNGQSVSLILLAETTEEAEEAGGE